MNSKGNNNFIMKPKVDFCFKELMADAEVRRGFISALLGVSPETIEDTKLMATHLRMEHLHDKLGILDICVLLNGTDQIDMEIQVASFPLWPERSLFYLSKMFAGRISEGDSYDRLGKCIHVGILDFELFPQIDDYYSCYHIWEDNHRHKYTDKMEIHVLELPKLSKNNAPGDGLLDWARFLGAECREEMERMAEKNEYIGKAYDRLNNISGDLEKRMEYLAREKAIRDHNYLMAENLRQGMAKGLAEGRAQGLEEGRAEGRVEGRAEGRTEGEVLKLINQIRKKVSKGISAEECADMLEEEISTVCYLYNLLKEHPDWNDSMIYEEAAEKLKRS